MLGIATPPEKGEYLVEPSDHPGQKSDIWKQYETAMQRPWWGGWFPLIAKWLADKRRPMDLLVGASSRPRWYSPLIPDGSLLPGAQLPAENNLRVAGRVLTCAPCSNSRTARLNRRGQTLSRFIAYPDRRATRPLLVEGLIAITLDNGLPADTGFAATRPPYGRPSREDAGRLGRLPPMAKMIDKLDAGERFMVLDGAAAIAAPARAMRSESPASRNPARLPSTGTRSHPGTEPRVRSRRCGRTETKSGSSAPERARKSTAIWQLRRRRPRSWQSLVSRDLPIPARFALR